MKLILWHLIGFNNSILDNRFMYHVAGGYMIAHITSLFFKKYYWTVCFFVAVFKELCDHYLFGCGGNELKHFMDILSWSLGGLSYFIIVLLKRKRYNYS